MSDLVHSIEYIFKKPGGYLDLENKNFYNIPEYQRGYKWAASEITKLLNDIARFEGEGERFYCLQNITIVSRSEGYYNVVDGQQRLTTLVVLLAFLGESKLVSGKLQYKIRPKTEEFINDYILSNNIHAFLYDNDLFKCWQAFIVSEKGLDHQDIFYLFSTAHTIFKWFENTNKDKKLFTLKLLKQVKLIVNIVKSGSEEKIFGNLNSNRIPLDGADLVRAILITRVANEEGLKAGDIKNIVRVNERRVRIGWELDEINNWWSKKEIQDFFKYFVSISSRGDVTFNQSKHPINLLLLIYAETQSQTELTLDFIEYKGNRAIELFTDLKKLHQTLQDWHSNRRIYHFLGYLFAQKNARFYDIWTMWHKVQTREKFVNFLKEKIRQLNFGTRTIQDVFDKKEDWFADKGSLVRVLLLLDIISCIKSESLWLPAKNFVRDGNDIEHIFPQKPEKIKDKAPFIKFLIDNDFAVDEKNILANYESRQYEYKYQVELDEFINKHIANVAINSIGNLVLLDESLNRSMKNSGYAKKRGRVIQYFQTGTFIQPHTFSIFVRFLLPGNIKASQDMHHWTNVDIESNTKSIKEKLESFYNMPQNEQ